MEHGLNLAFNQIITVRLFNWSINQGNQSISQGNQSAFNFFIVLNEWVGTGAWMCWYRGRKLEPCYNNGKINANYLLSFRWEGSLWHGKLVLMTNLIKLDETRLDVDLVGSWAGVLLVQSVMRQVFVKSARPWSDCEGLDWWLVKKWKMEL